MRRTLSLVPLIVAGLAVATPTSPALAQGVPSTLTFAGRLSDATGPVSGQHAVIVRLFEQPTSGAETWSETHAATMFTQGLVYLTLGETTPLDATVFDGGPLFLEVVIDGTAMTPRLAIGSVPYAVRADVATSADTAGALGTLAPADVVTSIVAGAGLTGGGTGNRITVGMQPCPANHYFTHDGAAWQCTPVPSPGLTGVLAGIGLVGGGSTGAPSLAADLAPAGGDAGAGRQLARADHIHDGRYFTEAELATVGMLNLATNPLEWTRLKGVPAGLADGIDNDTTYSSGTGLSLAGTVFNVVFGGTGGDSGGATTVARSDHAHDGRYPIMAGRGGGQSLYGGVGAGEDLVLRSTSSATRGEIYLGDDGSPVSIGGGAPSAALDVNGEIRSNAVYKFGFGTPAAYEISTARYIVDAPPSTVGQIVPLDNAIIDQLCRDKDGCDMSMAMINWDPAQPGNVAHRKSHMFLSESSRWWRADEEIGAPAGLDGNNVVQEIRAWDCFLTDAETPTVPASPNGRVDLTAGWGFFNCQGCDNSDTTTTCRLTIQD